MNLIIVLAISLVCATAIIAGVLVGGGIYQSMLFDEYMEDLEDSEKPKPLTNPNFPEIDVLP